MTASQVASYAFPQELPILAQHPDVQVHWDLDELDYAPDLCGWCEQAVGGPVKDSTMAVSHRFRLDIDPSRTGICSADHGDRELNDVLHNLTQAPAEVILHLSSDPTRYLPAPVPAQCTPRPLPGDLPSPARTLPALVEDPDDDLIWQRIDGLRRFISTLPAADVETFRAKILAAVESVAVDRIEQLGRVA